MSNENVEGKNTHANVTLAKEANARAAAMKKRLESARAALKGLNMADKEQPAETVEAQRPEMSTNSELEKQDVPVDEPPEMIAVPRNVFIDCTHDHVGIYFEKEMEFYNACVKKPAYLRRLLSAEDEERKIKGKIAQGRPVQCTIQQHLAKTVLTEHDKGSDGTLDQCDHGDIVKILFVQFETFFRERWKWYAHDLIDIITDRKYY